MGEVHRAALLVAVSAAAVGAAGARVQDFFATSQFNLGWSRAPLLADIDLDGKLDVVAARDGSFVVLRGDGLGGFGALAVHTLGAPSLDVRQLWVLDADGDGRADLLTFVGGPALIASLRQADGSLGPAVTSPLPPSNLLQAGARTFGDFDADGRQDLAFASTTQILVARGLPGGAFAPAQVAHFDPAAHHAGLAAVDFDGDGDLDLAASSPSTGVVVVAINDGQGAFGATATVATAVGAGEVVWADADADGQVDVVFESWTAPYGARWARGLGAGVFAPPMQLFTLPVATNGLRALDLDRDGRVDWVAQSTGVVHVVMGLGNGVFALPVAYAAEHALFGAGDVNGDGHVDLVSAASTFVTILAGDGAGGLAAPLDSAPDLTVMRAADVDLDGQIDLIGRRSAAPSDVGVRHGTPGGGLGPTVFYPSGTGWFADLAVGDLNLDGRSDVVLAGHKAIVLLGAVGGGFGAPSEYDTATGTSTVSLGDVSADGWPDVIVSLSAPAPFAPTTIQVLRGDGAGGLLAPQTYYIGDGAGATAVADFDNDGFNDLATQTSQGLVIQFGRSGGWLSSPRLAAPFGGWGSLTFVDLDADGILDFIDPFGPAVLYGDGSGGFPRRQRLEIPIDGSEGLGSAICGDFDGDGRLDVAIGTHTGFAVFLQRAGSTFEAGRSFGSRPELYVVHAGDANLDGRVDLLVVGPGPNGLPETMLNLGLGPSTGLYCTSKLNSLGCAPSMTWSGASSASLSSGFTVRATSLVNQKNGLLVYGLTGGAATPFADGTRCVALPLLRTLSASSGGSPSSIQDCSGELALDLNAFASGALGGSPNPALSQVGAHMHCQFMARDVGPAAGAWQLSDALQYTVGP